MHTQLVVGAAFYFGDMLFYAILFLVLMYGIKLVAWKPITKMMQKRADKIANDIDSAQKSRDEADRLEKERNKALASSQDEAIQIVNDAEANGNKQRDKIVADAQSDATAYKDRAHQEIKDERAEVLASAKDDVADLSIEIASKIINKNLDAKDQAGIIDSYIEELGKDDTK